MTTIEKFYPPVRFILYFFHFQHNIRRDVYTILYCVVVRERDGDGTGGLPEGEKNVFFFFHNTCVSATFVH